MEHEHVVEAVQTRLDRNPQAMRVRRETVEHPFATLKMRMGATHFLMRRLKNVATEIALNVLGYNLTRVMSSSVSNRYWPLCGRDGGGLTQWRRRGSRHVALRLNPDAEQQKYS